MAARYRNLRNLELWLKDKCKSYNDNIYAYLDELKTQYGETGSTCYELSSTETKSGNPECYYYDISESELEPDCYETTYIF